MSDLTEFLFARIAEDEAVARDAMCDGNGKWASWNRSWDDAGWRDLAADGERITALPTSIDEHVCHHDPARILAECDAKRRIVERYAHLLEHGDSGDARWVLPLLAQPYTEHADYREEWAV